MSEELSAQCELIKDFPLNPIDYDTGKSSSFC
jgi:hypothetical protein